MKGNIDIPALIRSLLSDCGSLDMAEAEFRRMILDDEAVREAYRAWCEEYDTTDRRGFADYAEEYLDNQESVWDTLSDYNDND